MRKQLAIGIDDFRRIREEDYFYIDKTLLIRDFLTYKKYVSLITRPRRFGKTLNMTMMREFFDISKDSKDIFKGLDIMNTEFAKQMNTVPVIYLTFKNCSGSNPEALKESLAKAVWEEYMRYAGLFGTTVDKEDDHFYKFYLTYQKLREEAITDSILESSLSRLMRAVYAFYGKRPIVLIDEYDHPLIKSYEKGFYDKFSDLYTNFLGEALKGNEFLGQALLTGIQQIAKESIFSELNNFLVYTSLSKQYAAYFGMQKNEVKKMLSYYKMELTEDISTFYNGYVFGDVEIYNPWSLLSYLDAGTLKPYWRNTSTNTLVRALIKDADHDFMGSFERLLIAGEVKVAVNLEASLQKHSSPRVLWGMFVNTGYLTIIRESSHGMNILRIPNMEAKEEIRRMIASYTRLSNEKLSDLFVASISNDINAFVKVLQNLVCDYDGIYKFYEDNYRMLFLGMAASVTGFYRFLHYPQLGSTVSGFALQSMNPDLRPSLLVEMRKGDDVENLKQDALAEILHGRYYTGLEGKVLCVGLARNERTCEIAVKRIQQKEISDDGTVVAGTIAPPITARSSKAEASGTELPETEVYSNEAPNNLPPENAAPNKAVAPKSIESEEIHEVVPRSKAAVIELVPPPESVSTAEPENITVAPSIEQAPSAKGSHVAQPIIDAKGSPLARPSHVALPITNANDLQVADQATKGKASQVAGQTTDAKASQVALRGSHVAGRETNAGGSHVAQPATSAKGSHVAQPATSAKGTQVAGQATNAKAAQVATPRGSHVAQPATSAKGQQETGQATNAGATQMAASKGSHVAQPTTSAKGSQVTGQATNAKGSHVAQPTTSAKATPVTGQATDTKTTQVAGQATDAKTTQTAGRATDVKTTPAAGQATNVSGQQVAPPVEVNKVAPGTKQPPPAKATTSKKQAESTKANTTTKQAESTKSNTPTKQIESIKINTTAKQAESSKAITVAEPAKAEDNPVKSIGSKKTKEAESKKAKKVDSKKAKKTESENSEKLNGGSKKRPKKSSFMKILAANIHIILAILFLFGAIFFAVTNFRANRAITGAAMEYQVHATLMIEQVEEVEAINTE